MNPCYPFVNTPLKYAYDALEPYIDEKTMRLHHDKHLQTYIDNLNGILEKNPGLQKRTLEELIMNWCRLPDCLQVPVRNNAGGVYNHRFFFDGLTPYGKNASGFGPDTCGCDLPANMTGYLAAAIDQQFGSFENFRAEFKKEALAVFGSGYAWLVIDRCRLKIIMTANQDTPLKHGLCPLLNLDVWEHAYYLKHYNVRADYIDDWFQVVDWNKAEQRFCENS